MAARPSAYLYSLVLRKPFPADRLLQKFELSLLNLKKLLGLVLQSKKAPSQKIAEMLKAKTVRRKERKLYSKNCENGSPAFSSGYKTSPADSPARELRYVPTQQVRCVCLSGFFWLSKKKVVADLFVQQLVSAEHSGKE